MQKKNQIIPRCCQRFGIWISQGVNWRLLHSLDLDRVIREGDVDMIQASQLPTAEASIH